jgi:hypothetical protein
MAAGLAGLDRSWTILGDRRLVGWSTPVTVIAAPARVRAVGDDAGRPGRRRPFAAQFDRVVPGWQVRAQVGSAACRVAVGAGSPPS